MMSDKSTITLGTHTTISIGNNLLSDTDTLKAIIPANQRLFLITQKELYEAKGKALEDTIRSKINPQCHTLFVTDGEEAKSLQGFESLMNQIFKIGVERSDLIIGLGGGVVTDLAAYVASVCLRGLPLVLIPTTLLSQVDAAIGGKTGINHSTGKNLIGTFYQPQHILIDPHNLTTLDKRECFSGFAEVIKYGIIHDNALFHTLETKSEQLKHFDFESDKELWKEIIEQSCKNKVRVVEEDEKEKGLRQILNFGHTIGHGLEALFNFKQYKHGECVIFGSCAATYIAEKQGLISQKDANKIYDIIKSYGYDQLKLDIVDIKRLLTVIKRDKKVKQSIPYFILPTSVGNVIITNKVSEQEIENSVKFIRSFFKGVSR